MIIIKLTTFESSLSTRILLTNRLVDNETDLRTKLESKSIHKDELQKHVLVFPIRLETCTHET